MKLARDYAWKFLGWIVLAAFLLICIAMGWKFYLGAVLLVAILLIFLVLLANPHHDEWWDDWKGPF